MCNCVVASRRQYITNDAFRMHEMLCFLNSCRSIMNLWAIASIRKEIDAKLYNVLLSTTEKKWWKNIDVFIKRKHSNAIVSLICTKKYWWNTSSVIQKMRTHSTIEHYTFWLRLLQFSYLSLALYWYPFSTVTIDQLYIKETGNKSSNGKCVY